MALPALPKIWAVHSRSCSSLKVITVFVLIFAVSLTGFSATESFSVGEFALSILSDLISTFESSSVSL